MDPSGTTSLRIAGLGAFLGVALGAFGAHALADRLAPDRLAIFQTAVQYQLVHSLALFGCALLARGVTDQSRRRLKFAVRAFTVGLVVFPGSLYLVAFGFRSFGAVAPVGGTAFLIGWALLATLRLRSNENV